MSQTFAFSHAAVPSDVEYMDADCQSLLPFVFIAYEGMIFTNK